MKIIKKFIISLMLVFSTISMTFTLPIHNPVVTVQAATIKLNKKSLTLKKGQSSTLKVTGTKKKVQWSSSNKKIATVSSKGKVTAKKAGTTYIKAKVNGKTLSCKVVVKNTTSSTKKSTKKESTTYVYITATGSKYHRTNSCGRTNPANTRKVSLKEAQNSYSPCSKCY